MELHTAVGIFLVALGAVAMLFCLREIFYACMSTRWPQVAGLIRDVELEPDAEQGSYHASIVYAYRVDGKDFSATRIRFGPVTAFADKADVRARLGQFRIGHGCTVYVHPTRPARAVLLPGLSGASFLAPALACLPIYLGAEMLW